ncbi:hypothetical protein [Streptacidiphilus anmyonensis]|uniref:hypothetical protein n=1 Tax=Streptacidiphilus anmyonensis TaxID=405782 RepID=UPI0005A7B5EE|nr:hypothetical protein [Streptacidiphilus anmyonensis]
MTDEEVPRGGNRSRPSEQEKWFHNRGDEISLDPTPEPEKEEGGPDDVGVDLEAGHGTMLATKKKPRRYASAGDCLWNALKKLGGLVNKWVVAGIGALGGAATLASLVVTYYAAPDQRSRIGAILGITGASLVILTAILGFLGLLVQFYPTVKKALEDEELATRDEVRRVKEKLRAVKDQNARMRERLDELERRVSGLGGNGDNQGSSRGSIILAGKAIADGAGDSDDDADDDDDDLLDHDPLPAGKATAVPVAKRIVAIASSSDTDQDAAVKLKEPQAELKEVADACKIRAAHEEAALEGYADQLGANAECLASAQKIAEQIARNDELESEVKQLVSEIESAAASAEKSQTELRGGSADANQEESKRGVKKTV